jgi:hypothetical protein
MQQERGILKLLNPEANLGLIIIVGGRLLTRAHSMMSGKCCGMNLIGTLDFRVSQELGQSILSSWHS